MTTYDHYYTYPGTHTATLSIWFTQYPSMPHHRSSGIADRYDFSTYSMKIDVGPAGVETITGSNASLNLYPNPNNGIFRLVVSGIDGNQNVQLQITNLLGEVVYRANTHSNNGTILQDINIQNVSEGTYFVRVITADKVYNTKTVLNR
jgi:hypothetical protein